MNVLRFIHLYSSECFTVYSFIFMQNLSAIFKFDCAFLNASELGNCSSCAAVAGEEKKVKEWECEREKEQ